jgi:hypothetical protein
MKKSNTLKFSSNKEDDNIETVLGINDIIKEWLKSIELPFESQNTSIKNFEFKNQLGFIPQKHNRGGLDLIAISDIAYITVSDKHIGLPINSWIDDWLNEIDKIIALYYPELHPKTNEFSDKVQKYCNDNHLFIVWRVRAMYAGNGVLRIYAGFDKDIRYLRWNSEADFKAKIHFKTLSGLKRQLSRLTKKIEKSQIKTEKQP